MAVPTSIDDLSATAASNGPDGATDLPSAYDDYIRAVSAFIRQLRDGKEFPPLLSSVAGTDTITASAPAAITAYAAGQRFSFVASATNTGAVTLNINSLGAKDVTKRGATALSAGDIASGQVVLVEYDGARFQMIGAVFAASETVAGVVELATNSEAQAGTDTTRVITPASLASVTATATRAGVIELATSAEAQTGTDTGRAITPATMKASQMVSSSPVATTSGATVDLSTSVPAWAKRLTLLFNGVSTSGTNPVFVQIGDSGGFATTGYLGAGSSLGGAVATSNYTTGFGLFVASASRLQHGSVTLSLADASTNTWIASGVTGCSDAANMQVVAGSKSLSAALDRVRVSTADTFDAGSITLTWE